MTLSFWQFLIVCPLVGLAGFVDAVAGGGGLIALPSYLIAGLPVHFAIGTSKLSSSMGTTLATVRYAKMGYIPWKLALICAVGALAGSKLGAELALLVNDRFFKILMLFILPLTELYILRTKALNNTREPLSPARTAVLGICIAFVVGAYDGFYGPGAGTFLILLLTGVGHMRLETANGTAKAINLTTNITALVVFLTNGTVLLPLGLAAGAFNLAGNYIGTRFFSKGGAKAAKPIMLIVLGVFFVKVLSELLGFSL